MDCGPGTEWNEAINNCDWPAYIMREIQTNERSMATACWHCEDESSEADCLANGFRETCNTSPPIKSCETNRTFDADGMMRINKGCADRDICDAAVTDACVMSDRNSQCVECCNSDDCNRYGTRSVYCVGSEDAISRDVCASHGWAGYHAYPCNCNDFVVCGPVEGMASHQTCADLYWNNVHKVCDLPYNVGCDLDGEGGEPTECFICGDEDDFDSCPDTTEICSSDTCFSFVHVDVTQDGVDYTVGRGCAAADEPVTCYESIGQPGASGWAQGWSLYFPDVYVCCCDGDECNEHHCVPPPFDVCAPEPPECEVEEINSCVYHLQAEIFSGEIGFGGLVDLMQICGTFEASMLCIEQRQVSCSNGFQAQLGQTVDFFRAVLEIPCAEPICREAFARQCVTELEVEIQRLLQLEEDDPLIPVSHVQWEPVCMEISITQVCVESNFIECDLGDNSVVVMVTEVRAALNRTLSLIGPRCRNPCRAEPCMNDGMCTPTADFEHYTCFCPSGYYGDNCQNEAECDLDIVWGCLEQARFYTTMHIADPCGWTAEVCTEIESTHACLFGFSLACDDDVRLQIGAVMEIFTGIESKCVSINGDVAATDDVCYSCENAGSDSSCNWGRQRCGADQPLCKSVYYEDPIQGLLVDKMCTRATDPDCALADPWDGEFKKYCCDREEEGSLCNEDQGDYGLMPISCEPEGFECYVIDTVHCLQEFQMYLFREMARPMPNYGSLCVMWEQTRECAHNRYVACSNGFKASVEYTLGLYEQIMGQACADICYIDRASQCILALELLVQPIVTSDPLFNLDFDFCGSFLLEVNCFTTNLINCPEVDIITLTNLYQLQIEYVGDSCPDPCLALDCGDYGTCVATDIDEAHCDCYTDWTGVHCERPNVLFVYGDQYFDYRLEKEEEDSAMFMSSTIEIPSGLLVFNKRYNHLFIAERGYVTFGEKSYQYLFDELPEMDGDLSLLAPLFAQQDIACGPSVIYYHIYSSTSTDLLTHQIMSRANAEINNYYELDSEFEATTVIVITWYQTQPFRCATYEGFFGREPGSTFQLVIVANGMNTYATYRYEDTNVEHLIPNVHIGYVFPNVAYTNPMSGSDAINAIATTFIDIGAGLPGLLFMQLYTEGQEMTDEDRCINWYESTVDLNLHSHELSPCPCNLAQAQVSGAFYQSEVLSTTICFTTVKAVPVYDLGQAVRTCCYLYIEVEGPLVAYESSQAGTLTLLGDTLGVIDAAAFEYCCGSDENDGMNTYCSNYYAKRPVNDCEGFDAAISAFFWGDPHIETLDGLQYTFNGIGEYTMVTTFDGTFTLQARTAQITNSNGEPVRASKWSAFAAQVPGDSGMTRVQIEMNDDETDFVVLLDGQAWQSSDISDPIIVNPDLERGFINVTFHVGWRMDVGLNEKMFTFVLTVPNDARGNTRGLLGTFTDNQDDDLTLPDGSRLSLPRTTEEIHYEFGLGWAVDDSTSVFTYPAGTTSFNYRDWSFIPVFEAECSAEEQQWVDDNCGGSTQCRYDYCVTKDAGIATNTMINQVNYMSGLSILNNSAPIVSAPHTIQVELGEEVVFVVTGSDAEDSDVTVEIIYEVEGATFDPATGHFRWTPTDATAVEIAFIARDTVGGVSSAHTVVVHYCSSCSSTGQCNYNVTNPVEGSNTFRVAMCECDIGWRGQHCQHDIDGCTIDPCSTDQVCVDVVPLVEQNDGFSYTCDDQVVCPTGEQLDSASGQCVDINECLDEPCAHICHNQAGRFRCECTTGYELHDDDRTCNDEDECARNPSPCGQTCANSVGSYTCSCLDGWQLQPDDTCLFTGECIPDCQHGCRDDQVTCICNPGYRLADDDISCEDENECTIEYLNMCEERDRCTNTAGGYECGCRDGYQTHSNGRTCEPCTDNTYGAACAQTCDCSGAGWTCHHRVGCQCITGYSLNRQTNDCEDTNECLREPCGDHSDCTNTAGSYMCACAEGYVQDNVGECEDIDECLDSSMCLDEENGYCLNQPGGFTCECNAGYEKVDGDCTVEPVRTTLTFVLRLDLVFNNFVNNNAFWDAVRTRLESSAFFAGFSDNFLEINLRGLVPGSILYQFDALFNGALTDRQISEIGDALRQAIADNGDVIRINNQNVPVMDIQYGISNNPSNTISVDGICFLYNFLDTCANGQCDATANVPSCTCDEGYTGPFCDDVIEEGDSEEEKDTKNASAATLAIVLGTLGGVLVIAVVIIVIVVFCRNSSTPEQVMYRNNKGRLGYLDEDQSSKRGDTETFPNMKRAPRHYPSWYQSVWPFRYLSSPPPTYATNAPAGYAYDNPQAPIEQPLYGVYA